MHACVIDVLNHGTRRRLKSLKTVSLEGGREDMGTSVSAPSYKIMIERL